MRLGLRAADLEAPSRAGSARWRTPTDCFFFSLSLATPTPLHTRVAGTTGFLTASGARDKGETLFGDAANERLREGGSAAHLPYFKVK